MVLYQRWIALVYWYLMQHCTWYSTTCIHYMYSTAVALSNYHVTVLRQ